ncbi:MAG: hypothetical protein [Bacteriophage sp.]|nr:MAG: hypothetical protein [Bacteriophage sp.]
MAKSDYSQLLTDLKESKDYASKARNKMLCAIDDRLANRFDGHMTQQQYEQLSCLNDLDDQIRLFARKLDDVLATLRIGA